MAKTEPLKARAFKAGARPRVVTGIDLDQHH